MSCNACTNTNTLTNPAKSPCLSPSHRIITGRNVMNIILCNLLGLIIGRVSSWHPHTQPVTQPVRGFPAEPQPRRRSQWIRKSLIWWSGVEWSEVLGPSWVWGLRCPEPGRQAASWAPSAGTVNCPPARILPVPGPVQTQLADWQQPVSPVEWGVTARTGLHHLNC